MMAFHIKRSIATEILRELCWVYDKWPWFEMQDSHTSTQCHGWWTETKQKNKKKIHLLRLWALAQLIPISITLKPEMQIIAEDEIMCKITEYYACLSTKKHQGHSCQSQKHNLKVRQPCLGQQGVVRQEMGTLGRSSRRKLQLRPQVASILIRHEICKELHEKLEGFPGACRRLAGVVKGALWDRKFHINRRTNKFIMNYLLFKMRH